MPKRTAHRSASGIRPNTSRHSNGRSMMLGLADKQMLIQALGQVIYDEVQAVVKPLHDRIAVLEQALAGKIDAEFVRNYVGGAMAAITIPPDPGGSDGHRAHGTGV